jgi:hypothetical protein
MLARAAQRQTTIRALSEDNSEIDGWTFQPSHGRLLQLVEPKTGPAAFRHATEPPATSDASEKDI